MQDSHPAISPFAPELVVCHDLMNEVAIITFIDPPGFAMTVTA